MAREEDMGGMVLMPALTGSDVIRRLTYTAEEFDAVQMQRWGLVTELAEDPRAAALALAQNIAGNSPAAVRAAKRLIGVAETKGRGDVLLAESREQAGLIGAPEQIEVVTARMQKRDPVFR
jgi:enoyl-CoA hydratase/carnithine racemase